MSRTIEIAANAAASSWTNLAGIIAWHGSKWGGMAHGCEVGTGSGFDLDDDAGTRTLPAKRVVRAIENATTPATVLFKGRVSDKGLGRGEMPVDDAKKFDVGLDDNNSQVLGIPVDGWARPAETGWARIQALGDAYLDGSPRASTVIDYTTYVPNTNTVPMPAKTYIATDVGGVIRDCATTEGKQSFINVDDQLFYDLDTSTAFAAGLAITDDAPNLTDEFAPDEPRGSEEGNEFFSGAKLRYGTSSSVEDVRSGAEAAHDYWRTVFWDGDAKASTAAQRLATMLDNQSIEEKRYTCSLQLEADQVDLIKYGHTVSFRSAAAGVLTPTTLRVASLYWEPIAVDLYKAHLELGVPEKLAPRVRRGSPPPAPPEPFVCVPTDFRVQPLVDLSCVINASNPGGDRACTSLFDRTPAVTVFLYAAAVYKVRYSVFHGPLAWKLTAKLEAPGHGVYFTFAAGGDNDEGEPPIPLSGWITGSVSYDDDYYIELQDFPRTGRNGVDSSVFAEIVYVSGADPRFEGLGPCENGEPSAGQPITGETIISDGSTTTLHTNFPYVPGSLTLNAQGAAIVPDMTDPATGEFEIPAALPPGTVIHLHYTADVGGYLGTGNPLGTSTPEIIPYPLLGTDGDGSGDNVLHDDGTWRPEGEGGSDALVPYYIPVDETYTVPLYKQALFAEAIEVDGALVVNGVLIGVD